VRNIVKVFYACGTRNFEKTPLLLFDVVWSFSYPGFKQEA
jgi:hypothetical protein